MEVLYIRDPPSCQSRQQDASIWSINTNVLGSYSQGPFFMLKKMSKTKMEAPFGGTSMFVVEVHLNSGWQSIWIFNMK
jgi:hypothetical protein